MGLRLGTAVLGAAGRGVGHLVEVGPAREVPGGGDGLSGEGGVHHLIGEEMKWRFCEVGFWVEEEN